MQVNLEFVYDLTPETIDQLLADLRAGTSPFAPAPQTAAPSRTWHVGQDTAAKSIGARDVPSPNDPGGIGDSSGVAMLRRIERDPQAVRVRPTRERLVVDGAGVLDAVTSADGEAQH